MRNLLLISVCLLGIVHLRAQGPEAEADIRKLEEAERRAVLNKDTASLRKLWGKEYMVNAPVNRVVLAGDDPVARPVIMQVTYSSFTREIEEILVKDNVVFSMGSEIIVVDGNGANAGKPIKRRYTNIWMKENNEWRLVARHANEICK